MEKRRSPRVDFRVRAASTVENTNHKGYIRNFSREGMLKVIPNEHVLNILPGTILEVNFETPSGEKLNLECEVKWVRHSSNLPFGLNHHVGIEVKKTCQHYKEFIHELYNEYLQASTTIA
ncbi:MAG: PilZ domain-containing protein [Promethearchaeota archaeon]|jgi:hypothetical protein